MNLLNKLTIKNLQLNKKRTVMTVIGIILSVALLTAVASMFFSARESMILYQKQEQGNYHYGFASVSKEDLQKLEQNRKIETIYITNVLGYAKLDGVENEYKPYAYIREYDENALNNMCINLTDGRLPENAEEIVIPTHLKNNGGLEYHIGDTITLEVGERVSDGVALNQYNPFHPEIPEEIINAQMNTYTVVGIMERFPYRLENFEAPGYTFVSYLENKDSVQTADIYLRYTKEALNEHLELTAQILDVDEEAFTTFYGGNNWKLTEEERTKISEKLAEPKYDSTWNDYLVSLESGILGHSTLNALAAAAVIVVFIIIGTSVFCIKNSFDISITEKIRQYGMLASIGATKKQIRKNVYYEAFILGGMGIPIGILSGIFAAYVLIHVSDFLLTGILGFDLIFSFSWFSVLVAVILGSITILLSAQRSARKASKIAPIQAIRNNEEVKIRRKEVKSPKWVKRFFGIGGEISYKNLQRSKRKYRTTVISIVVCVSVFIALSSFINMAYDMIRAEYQEIDHNMEIIYYGSDDTYGALEEVRELEEVTYVSCVSRNSVEFETDVTSYTKEYLNIYPDNGQEGMKSRGHLNVYVLDSVSFQKYVESLNLDYAKVKEKGILLNTIYLDIVDIDNFTKQLEMGMYTLKEGDVVEGQVNLYNKENETHTNVELDIEIAKITKEPPIGIERYSNSASLVVDGSYREKIINKYRSETYYIESEDAERTQDKLEVIFAELENEADHFSINNIEENANEVRSFYILLSIFLYGFIAVIALIGVTNIFNTLTTNMNLRRREFAMLRSVGMTKKEFNCMIQLESFFYGMKSLVIGIPLGIALSGLIYEVMMKGQLVLAYRIPIEATLLSAAAVFVLITAIMKYSLGKINQQNTIETIRNENI